MSNLDKHKKKPAPPTVDVHHGETVLIDDTAHLQSGSVSDRQVVNRNALDQNEQVVVALRDEYLDVKKNWVETGAVLIKKRVETQQQTVPVDLEYEEVEVQRVPVNRILAPGESVSPRNEGDVLIVPVVEEEVVVTKRLVVREEIRILKRRMQRRQEFSDTVRSEQLQVETTGDLEFTNE